MNGKKVLFLHGLESKPFGAKAIFLQGNGFDVRSPALPKDSFSTSVDIAQSEYDNFKPDYVVGSSRGGAIAMAINTKRSRVVLIAPAWEKYGVAPIVPPDTTILHSKDDDVIPIEDSCKLPGLLRVCGNCHRMSDEDALYNLISVLTI